MATLALIFYAVYLALAFGLRTAIQVRRPARRDSTASADVPAPRSGSPGVGFVLALVIGRRRAGARTARASSSRSHALDTTGVHAAGIVLATLGIAATLYAQIAMGTSWRIGVDPSEHTALVTTGPFALVRNPIFAAMLPTALGLALLVPSWIALAGFAGLLLALELQVRVVEEPYLRRAHGSRLRRLRRQRRPLRARHRPAAQPVSAAHRP